ncbi:MAG: hypothetical protein REI45_09230, partial [Propionicimonas sp.]|nr:hypothetical protein [Propionicimonas sp.]
MPRILAAAAISSRRKSDILAQSERLDAPPPPAVRPIERGAKRPVGAAPTGPEIFGRAAEL